MNLIAPLKCLAVAAALTLAATPVLTSMAEAGSKKSNGMMRLGGPKQTSRNSQMMRLGGPTNGSAERQSVDSGDYAIPGRFVSGRPSDVREYFLRRDQYGSGN
jgi:hypothetical protein